MRKKIALIGGGNIGGTLAYIIASKERWIWAKVGLKIVGFGIFDLFFALNRKSSSNFRNNIYSRYQY